MKSRRMCISILTLLLMVSGVAMAGSVFLNGKRIDGVTDQKFEKCTVIIDANGDVHIQADGYAVQGGQAGAKKPAAEKTPPSTTVTGLPGQRYWLIKQENYPGKVQYDVDIYINSVWFKRIRSGGDQVVQEITSKLQGGPNVIHFAATKNIGQQRKSFSPQVHMRIIIGQGNVGGQNVMIENPLIQYKRTANETGNFNDEFTIVAK
jgi:hypothetical protein